jgi:hypothetical protein
MQCGLSLVHSSDSDELGGDDSDIRQNWRIWFQRYGMIVAKPSSR